MTTVTGATSHITPQSPTNWVPVMSKAKKTFTTPESAAVWLAYEGICTLCERTILDLRSNTVDHVLPENLQNNPTEFEAVRQLYDLPADFDLNDFGNWVAAHPKCNSRKGQTIFEGVQAMCMILARAKRKGEQARKIHDRMLREQDFASVVSTLDHQVKSGAPTIAQMTILRELLQRAENAAPPEAQLLVDPERWEVVLIKPWGLATVSDGQHVGETPTRIADEHMKERWQCEKCSGYGPWHLDMETYIFRCLECGNTLGGRHSPIE